MLTTSIEALSMAHTPTASHIEKHSSEFNKYVWFFISGYMSLEQLNKYRFKYGNLFTHEASNPNLTFAHVINNPSLLNGSRGIVSTFEGERRKCEDLLVHAKERAARKIWFSAWIPYWYKPGNQGFFNSIPAHLK